MKGWRAKNIAHIPCKMEGVHAKHVANTMQNDRFWIQTVSNTRQMVQERNQKTQNDDFPLCKPIQLPEGSYIMLYPILSPLYRHFCWFGHHVWWFTFYPMTSPCCRSGFRCFLGALGSPRWLLYRHWGPGGRWNLSCDTVDGCENLHQLIDGLSHYL